MKIIPLHSAEPTFLRLTRFEWGVSLFFALLIPLFLQSILAFFGIRSSLPLLIGVSIVAVLDVFIVHMKGKEQDFLMTFIRNSRIPDCMVGVHPLRIPILNQASQGEEK